MGGAVKVKGWVQESLEKGKVGFMRGWKIKRKKKREDGIFIFLM